MSYDAGLFQMMYTRACKERDSVVEKLATVAMAHDRLLADNKRILNEYESRLTQLHNRISSDSKLIARLERDIERLKPKPEPEPEPEPMFPPKPKRPLGRPRKPKEPVCAT